MASVTQRIKQIKQPYGGYLKPSEFMTIQMKDNITLNDENISSGLVGIAVDYLTRFMLGTPVEKAFDISLKGAKIIKQENRANQLLKEINGLDSKSIINACKLVGFDVCYRSSVMGYKDVDEINPDKKTVYNINIMVNRSLKFFEEYGPIIKDGFTFEGGYTKTINAGDGDFLTKDTLWDFKVLADKPKSIHTLQILIYYIMGKHSIHDEFNNIKKLGIYNPRSNTIYIKEIKDIPNEIIDEVEKEVIGYTEYDGLKLDLSNQKNDNLVFTLSDYKNDDYEKQEEDELLTINDVMRKLNCSRYAVMKFYKNNGLPLFKEKNKYYIYLSELNSWIEKMEQIRKITLIVTLIFLFIFFMFIFVII